MPRGLILLALVACDPDPPCVSDLPSTCDPLYAPTFDNIYANTLSTTCAYPGTGCHAAEGASGGMVFEDPDESYELLLDGRVTPFDVECSLLIRRTHAEDPRDEMPPGDPLGEAELCALRTWIAEGATR